MSTASAPHPPRELGPDATVPCNGCTACCRGYLVEVSADSGDDVASYRTEPEVRWHDVTRRFLKRRPDDSCVYLEDSGCSIHDRKPYSCRSFDCRALSQHPLVPPKPWKRAILIAALKLPPE